MPRPINETEREATFQQIKSTAQSLMKQHGTAGLSMRAIAREIGISAPALYHYYKSMDDLITALILDAFNGLGDAAAQAAMLDAPYVEQAKNVMRAYRQWALEYPTQFQLIYGNPIPGYEAPRDLTVPASARTLLVLGQLFHAAIDAGEINPKLTIPPQNQDALQLIVTDFTNNQGSVLSAYITNIAWAMGHGIIMLELFEHLPPVIGDVDAFFEAQLDQLIDYLK